MTNLELHFSPACRYCDIKPGHFFLYANEPFIRLDNPSTSPHLAVNLLGGDFLYFEDTMEVYPVPHEFMLGNFDLVDQF